MLSKIDLTKIEEISARVFDQKFDQKFDQRFDKKFDEKFGPAFYKHMDFYVETKLRGLISDEIKKQVGNLPTRDEFYERMDKLISEVAFFRQEYPLIMARLDQIARVE